MEEIQETSSSPEKDSGRRLSSEEGLRKDQPGKVLTSLTLISRFLSIPTNTLLVKGKAGTGKTTLCLELLRSFAGERHAFYISTRVSHQRLVQEYPEIDKVLAPEAVRNVGDGIPRLTFDDLRLAKSSQIVDVTLEVLQKAKNPLIIYDSWDTISNELEPSERLKLEKTLLAAIDGRNGNSVFVAEEIGNSSLEFGADGVVTLSSTLEDEVRLRKMVVDKLRGFAVERSVRYFTLRGGRFEELQDFEFEIVHKSKRFTPLPDSDTHFSSGMPAADAIFGGFKRGSTLLIGMTPTTNKQFLAAILGPMFLNFLNRGGSGLVGLSEDNDESKILRPLRPYSDAKSLASLKILRYARVTELISAYDRMKSSGAKEIIVELDATFLEQEDDFRALLELCRRAKEHRNLLILVARRATQYMDRLQAIADLHVKVWQLGSYLLARELITNTPVFALRFALFDGTPSITATEVV